MTIGQTEFAGGTINFCSNEILRSKNRFISCPTCELKDFDHKDWCDFAAEPVQQSESVIRSANQPDTQNR